MSKDLLKQYTYYFIIGIVSFVALIFIPMLGSDVGVGFKYPETFAGKVVWWSTKAIMSIINVVVFYSFMQQAKINVRDDAHYKEANEILSKIKVNDYKPKSPGKWQRQQYGSKGTSIFITTALGTMAFTQAILTFDYVSMLTYLFTIIMGIVFGILQMKKAELYWTEEYWDYAKLKEKENVDN